MKSGRILLGASVATLASLAATSSCQLVAGLDSNFQPARDGGGPADGGTGGSGTDAGPGGCQPATYPDPPAIADDGKDVGPLTVAVHSVDLGDMGTVPGYDLDHTCTCTDDAGPTCAGRAMPSLYCDAPGGVDNQFAKIVELVQIPLGNSISSQTFSAKADAGYWTLIVQVKGYNGEVDDPSVQVALYPCAGLGTTPKWDGSDSWPVLDTAVTGTGDPVYVADGAYVSDHTLVATVPKVPITFGGQKQTITLTLSGAVLTGKLVNVNSTWRLIQGVLAARLGLADLFVSLSSYRDNNGAPLCTDSGFIYSTAKTSVCNDADILVDSTQPKSTTCDALSFAMGFTADPAILGPKVPVPTPTPGCPAGTDPATDSCMP